MHLLKVGGLEHGQVGGLEHGQAGGVCRHVDGGGCDPGLVMVDCQCREVPEGGDIPAFVWAVPRWSGSQGSGSRWCLLMAQGWVPVLLVADQIACQWVFQGLCRLVCTFSGTFCS